MAVRTIIKRLIAIFGYSLVKKNALGDMHSILKSYVILDTPIVMDVGAHYGESVTEYRNIFPGCKIYSFEPDPDSFKILTENTSRFRDIYCIQQALSSEPGDGSLFKNDASATNSLLPLSESAQSLWGDAVRTKNLTENVSIETLDGFCDRNNIERISILKIDVQGAEMHVLKGAKTMFAESRIDVVICEILTSPTYCGQSMLWEYLQFAHLHGLVLVDVLNPVRKHNKLLQVDVVFVIKDKFLQ